MRETSWSSWCCCLATVNTLVLQSSISTRLVLLTKYSNLTSGSWWNGDDLWLPRLPSQFCSALCCSLATCWNLKQTCFAWTLNAVFTLPATEHQSTRLLKRMQVELTSMFFQRFSDTEPLRKCSHLTTHARHTECHDGVDECLNYTSEMTSASCCTS